MSFALRRLVVAAAPRCTVGVARAAAIAVRPCVLVSRRAFSSGAAFTTSSAARKVTTHIAGLDVVPNGREVFIGLQREILASIETYNKQLGFEPACNDYARRFASHRLKVAEEEDDVSRIESRLWSGQIEELIEQAEHELDCVVLMNEEVKPWEKPSADQLAQYQALASGNFGQDVDQFKTGKPQQVTKEEQALIDEFWKPIDEEIRQDQAREEEERAQRRARK